MYDLIWSGEAVLRGHSRSASLAFWWVGEVSVEPLA
jgi:hypothetical protein